MGMTNSQFKSYIRLLIDDIEDALAKVNPNDKDVIEKLEKLLKNLQTAVEDL